MVPLIGEHNVRLETETIGLFRPAQSAGLETRLSTLLETLTMLIKTEWIGIYLQVEGGHWWIMADDGTDQYFGLTRPTDADVETFMKAVIRL